MNKIYGYARISRPQQSIERQIRNITKAFPEATIIREAYTGTTLDRPAWNKLFKNVVQGDTIVFDSVSRLSRVSEEGIKAYFDLYHRGISLIFLKEPYINTDIYAESMSDKIELTGTDADEILKGVNSYFKKLAERQIKIAFDQSEKEVEDLQSRTREGIETARLNGKQVGQRLGAKLNIKKEGPAKASILKHSRDFGGTLTDADCIKLAGISRKTYYKYKKQLREEM